MGAHGTLEWLPGKAVALTATCFPEAIVGPLPVFYPFIVSNPGEAAQAKRRIAAVTIGHLPPPLVAAGLSGDARDARAPGRRICPGRRARPPPPRAPRRTDRRDRAAQRPRRARPASTATPMPTRCCAASMPGCATSRISPSRTACTSTAACRRRTTPIRPGRRAPQAERAALLAALDGRRVAPGPAGAPARGRRDVLPTGRNLYTADPRMLPTPTAMDLGRARRRRGDPRLPAGPWRDAARARHRSLGQRDAAHRRRGDRPRPRADGLPADLGPRHRPRHRHRGAAAGRDRASAGRRHLAHLRPVPRPVSGADRAHRCRRPRGRGARGNRRRKIRSPPCGARPEKIRLRSRASSAPRPAPTAPASADIGQAPDRAAIGAAYLAAASHAYGGADGGATALPGEFAARVAGADLLVHASDDPGRDLLEGAEDAAFVGGFAAAAAALGRCTRPHHARRDRSAAGRARGRSIGRWRASCGPAPSIHASSPGRCATARAAPPNSPRPSTGWSTSRRDLGGVEHADRSRPRRLSRRPRGARLPAARKPRRRARHRRPARCGAPQWLVASPPQRYRRRSSRPCWRRRHERAPCAAAPAPACRRRCRPETACWCASYRGRHAARCLHRAVRGGARPWQRHHGGHRARQPAGARPDAALGAAVRVPRSLHWALRRMMALPFSQARYATMPRPSSTRRALPRNCGRRLRRRSWRWRRKSRSWSTAAAGSISTRYPPTSGCAPSDRPSRPGCRSRWVPFPLRPKKWEASEATLLPLPLRGRVGEGALAACVVLVERPWTLSPTLPLKERQGIRRGSA